MIRFLWGTVRQLGEVKITGKVWKQLDCIAWLLYFHRHDFCEPCIENFPPKAVKANGMKVAVFLSSFHVWPSANVNPWHKSWRFKVLSVMTRIQALRSILVIIQFSTFFKVPLLYYGGKFPETFCLLHSIQHFIFALYYKIIVKEDSFEQVYEKVMTSVNPF